MRIIRSVKIVSPVNKGKLQGIHDFLVEYNNCVNYYIKRLWSDKKFTGKYVDKNYIESGKARFNLTMRLIQSAGMEALHNVKSQRKLSNRKRKMPKFKVLNATLNRNMWYLAKNKNTYDWVYLHSGFKYYIPFHKTKMWNKWECKGFTLVKSINLSIKNNRLVIKFYFEKETPEIKKQGEIEGLDLGYVNLATCSDGQIVGKHLNQYIRSFGKRRRFTHDTITSKSYQELKKLDLSNINVLVLENLKYVKRGMFSRTHNRHLSHWLYAKTVNWLKQRCEEQGIRLEFKSPFKTSQYCRICGKWDRRNRDREKFKCVHCGHEEHADINGAKNLKLLGLAGAYSLRYPSNLLSNYSLQIA